MCGIAGVISFNSKTERAVLNAMIKTLNHRGPDNQGIIQKIIGSVNIGLAHARLSIIDLSMSASQPMTYKHFTIVYNGEIYNYKRIKTVLEKLGHKFCTNSDTEVILHAFEEWGTLALDKFIGMFSFALLDEKNRRVYFFRDRTGVKPLYYFWNNDTFLFGSELKAITSYPAFIKKINAEALGYYFKMGYIPAPLSIYQNTFKLKPGHFATLNLESHNFKINKYWDPLEYLKRPKLNIDYEEAKVTTKDLLISSCNYRMIADVPVGVFLSGGYDSTAVSAILQKDRTEKLKTFTIGFEEGNNEAPFAKETANYLGTDHTEYICTTKEAQNLTPQLSYFYDEPFADSSAIPTMLVSELAKNKVTVALSADGGDEIFAGYTRYISFKNNNETLNKLKRFSNSLSAKVLNFGARALKNESFIKHRLDYLAQLFNTDKDMRASSLFEGSMAMSDTIFRNLIKDMEYPPLLFNFNINEFSDPIVIAQAIDYQSYLPNAILTKVDRASMSVSLESREPLLDHQLFEFVAQLPSNYKYDGLTTKRILKDIVHQYIPKEMMNRPKAGFSLPIANWLRGDLKYLLDEYLNESTLQKSKIFNVHYVTYLLELFEKKQLHDESLIWRILQFQMWFQKWMKA